MYLIYKPADGDEQRWKYSPKRGIVTPERELIERLTDRNWSLFAKDVVQGNSLCRRALLFIFLKRQHPTLKFADVAFEWDELTLEYSKGELIMMRDEVASVATGDEAYAALQKLQEQIDEAYEDPDEQGKASLPIAE